MNIKPNKASTRDYRKSYLMGGGVDEERPEGGVQGASYWFQPSMGAQEWQRENAKRGLADEKAVIRKELAIE